MKVQVIRKVDYGPQVFECDRWDFIGGEFIAYRGKNVVVVITDPAVVETVED